MDTEDQIPPHLPLLKGGIPLFGILFLSLDRQRGVSLPAGRQGEIFGRICLFNYGLLSNIMIYGSSHAIQSIFYLWNNSSVNRGTKRQRRL
jgi:hypothetical protein